ncbi:hypothetical protein OAG53_02440 [Akkermansiaceae bacterium]|nr:hypothetical protein [Akkermansiaceae bacterium]
MGITTMLSTAKPKPEEMLGALEKSFAEWTRKYDDSKPAAKKELAGKDRVPALSYLRYLIELEEITRYLREDTAVREEQMKTDTLSDSDRKRLLTMREHAHIERLLNIIDPPRRGPSVRDQKKLIKGHLSKAKKFQSKLDKAQNELDKLLERDRPNQAAEKELDDEIDSAQKALEEIEVAFFGAQPDGFEEAFASVNPGPAEDLLKKVIEARDGVLKDLRFVENPGEKGESEGERDAIIAGVTVRSENLGVLLDRSGSMKPFLDPLREEISKDFPHAIFSECYGCALNWGIHPFSKAQRDQVMLFMEDLVIVQKADAIYWFSDLNDAITESGLLRLANLRQQAGFSMYVLSVKNKPSKDLMEQIDSFSKHKGK